MVVQRGGSFYDQRAVNARYIGHREPDRFSPNYVMEEPAVLAEIGDPTGLRVPDLGCGDGAFGRWLLAAGCASYRGIDGSVLMVERARQTLAGTSSSVEHGDLEDFAPGEGSADLITARLSLHYVADIAPVLAAAARALAPRGRLILTVVHPVITSHNTTSDGPRTNWIVDDYFTYGPRRRSWLGGTSPGITARSSDTSTR